ncbi:nucleotidyltransferase family protein [Sphingobacterium kitahiroshimense]|uniref:Nucleotidyltransferase family protein n=1 Tax=Sphingobacterium kitahiroshimense TaxID=470446 RepID=A0ABV0C0Y5_9SPHI
MDIRLRDVFFQLLRIGLWGKESLILTQPLSNEDWLQLRSYSIHHTVEGLIFDSFKYLEEDQLPPLDLRLKWTVRVDKIERHNIQMNKVIAAQYTTFTEMGLQPILQKGRGIAACYEVPLHRVSGDVDWYFEDSGYAEARKILKDKNIPFKDTAGFSLEYDWKEIHIEHHKNLFDIRSPFKKQFLRQLQEKHKNNQVELIINDVPVKLLAPELQLLQVNAHILKHLITFGIGLRQICDSARLYSSVADQIDAEALKNIYSKAGILEWAHLLHIVLEKHLGLPKERLPFPYPEEWNADWMMDEIWYSGNFGQFDKRFEGGKITVISVHPKGASRMWLNFKRYLRYAPQEVLFFPFVYSYSKFLGIDKD